MTVKLTPEMERLVEEKLQAGLFATAEDVLLAGLVSLSRDEEKDIDASAHAPVISMERLEELALEGLNSPSRERTAADFERVRQEIIDNYNKTEVGDGETTDPWSGLVLVMGVVIMTIELNSEMQKIVDQKIGDGKFATAEDVVLAALRSLTETEEVEAIGAPEHLRVTSGEQLKALLRDGLNTPGPRYTEADFVTMRKELAEHGRISKR
jgi:Arc/MetJ-type ribon-helix-helix transcriptional regulator